MKKTALTIIAVLLTTSPLLGADPSQSGANLGNVRGGDFSNARSIIDKNCTSCHESSKIEAALSTGKDMPAIQKEMEKRGARLNTNEREVLGIYWQQKPLKKK